MRILQWNAGRGLGGTNKAILRRLAVQKDVRVCLLQELVGTDCREGDGIMRSSKEWTVFPSGRAAVLVGQGLRACANAKWTRRVGVDGAQLDAAAVEIAGMTLPGPILFVSIYRDQLRDTMDLVDYLRDLLFQFPNGNVVVGGDFNMKSKALGAPVDGRGGEELRLLVEELQEEGGGCANTGKPTWLGRPTDPRGLAPTHIDGTLFSSSDESPIEVTDWDTGDQAHSDHASITFTVRSTLDQAQRSTKQGDMGATPPSNWFQFRRKACTPEALARFSTCAEALAMGTQGGLHLETPRAFASRVLGELQCAASHTGLIRPWQARPRLGNHALYGWNDVCEGLYTEREKARRSIRHANSDDELDESRDRWKTLHKELREAMKQARVSEWAAYCSELTSTTTSRELWSKFRRVAKAGKGSKDAATPMMRTPEGNLVVTAAEQAQLLTDHWAWRSSATHPCTQAFSSIGKDIIEHEYESIMTIERERAVSVNDTLEPLYCQLFTMAELDSVLASVPHGKAAGWDGVPYELLVVLGPIMRTRILQSINGLWVSGGVPKEWKEAILVPLGKKEAPSKPDDFRPVSLLVCLCKVHEALVHRRLEWVLDGRVKALPANDLGFRHNSTATQQVLRATQAAYEAWSRGQDLALILLDVDKAFDTIWGAGLVVKLRRLGIRGRMLRWIDDYMRGRRCRAVVEGQMSRDQTWDLGIGQGGILGPLFFVVYFSDLPVPAQTGGKYADDVSIWRAVSRNILERGSNIADLQSQLDAIHDWSRMWRMSFSPPKTIVVLLTPIRRRQAMLDHPLTLTMGGALLKQVMEGGSRLLGIWIDPHLRFDSHIGKVGEKAWRRIQVLRSISGSRWGADRVALTNLYLGWIRPVLEYGSSVYAGASREILSKLDKIQAAALRIITGTTSTVCVQSLHWETGIQYLGTRRLEEAAIMASNLRRSLGSANSAAADFQRWFELPESNSAATRLVWAATPEETYVKAGGRMSPFEIIGGAYKLVGMWHWDTDLEGKDAVAGGHTQPPWVTPPQPKSRDWPILKAASSRTTEGAKRARTYGLERVTKAYSDGLNDGKTVIMAYTDGSADPIRGGGGAAVVWEGGSYNGRTFSKDIGHIATSFMAEGEALLLAIAQIEEAVGTQDPTSVRVHLWSDCQPAIRLVDEGRTGNRHTYWKTAFRAKGMIKYLTRNGLEVITDWLPAHCGIVQNEAADQAANKAADRGREDGSKGYRVFRPHKVIRAAIRSRVNKELDEWYRKSPMAKRAKEMNPMIRPRDISHVTKSSHFDRAFETCLYRLRVGNETRPHARTRMGITETTECGTCGMEDGTEHRLFLCSTHAQKRIEASRKLSRINFSYKFNLATLIGLWGVRKGDMAGVLKVLADYMDSVPGMLEGFLETRSVRKGLAGPTELEQVEPTEPGASGVG